MERHDDSCTRPGREADHPTALMVPQRHHWRRWDYNSTYETTYVRYCFDVKNAVFLVPEKKTFDTSDVCDYFIFY
jgi:hypothetical protein